EQALLGGGYCRPAGHAPSSPEPTPQGQRHGLSSHRQRDPLRDRPSTAGGHRCVAGRDRGGTGLFGGQRFHPRVPALVRTDSDRVAGWQQTEVTRQPALSAGRRPFWLRSTGAERRKKLSTSCGKWILFPEPT